MNSKIDSQIISFMNSVCHYIGMEYDAAYMEKCKDKDFINDTLYDFIGSYYLGGNTVPDTARYVIELILMNSRSI